MKLGVGYLIFSGAELLKPAILQIRPHVDFIIGMVSRGSSDGHEAPAYLAPLVEGLVKEGLLDEVLEFKRGDISCVYKLQDCDRFKFEMGRKICVGKGCTHYMGCDCDEIYPSLEFGKALRESLHHDFYITRLLDYVKSPNYKAKQFSRLHSPFILKSNCKYVKRTYPVLLDTGRTVNALSFKVLPPDLIYMHHFTGVRYNKIEMLRKFQGHSHFTRLGEAERSKYLQRMENAHRIDEYEWIEDKFGINDYWQGEFKELYERTMNEK